MTQIADFLAPGPTGAQVTQVARRRARFKYAKDRITRIADGTPEFTVAELTELATILLTRAGRLAAAESAAGAVTS